MSDQLPNQLQPPPPKPEEKSSLGKGVISRIADYYCEWIGLKSVGDDVKEHVKVQRQGRFFASAFVVVTLAIIGGCQLRGRHDEAEIGTSNSLASSNAIVARIFESQAQDARQKVVEEKVDASNMQREKESEILNLKNEIASLHNRVTTLESSHVMEISSNLDSSLSNLLSVAAYPHANIVLWINDKTNLLLSQYTPGAIVHIQNYVTLSTNREIRMRVFNQTHYSALHTSIDFTCAINPTNIFSDGWIQEAIPDSEMTRWSYYANRPIPEYVWWSVSTLRVSTNFQNGSFAADITIGADGLETKHYVVGFLTPQ